MTNHERFKALLQLYVEGSISTAESEELFSLIDSGEFDDALKEHVYSNLLNADSIQGNDLPSDKARIMMMNILSAKRPGEQQKATVVRMPWARWAVAAVVVTISVSILLWKKNDSNTFHALIPNETTRTANNTDKDLLIKMEDGSSITLHPGTIIHYPAHFLANKREVYLEGAAFFHVSKNPERPFLVYSSETVTQVLGTSFTIKENKQREEIEVTVRTGRVQLNENSSFLGNDAEKKTGVIVTPNQKATYNKRNRRFEVSLVDHPVVITEDSKNDSTFNFNYEKATLSTVLNTLQAAYGIEIGVTNENIFHCIFTGDIARPDFYNKLSILTQSINASYEIKGTKIMINGKGCR